MSQPSGFQPAQPSSMRSTPPPLPPRRSQPDLETVSDPIDSEDSFWRKFLVLRVGPCMVSFIVHFALLLLLGLWSLPALQRGSGERTLVVENAPEQPLADEYLASTASTELTPVALRSLQFDATNLVPTLAPASLDIDTPPSWNTKPAIERSPLQEVRDLDLRATVSESADRTNRHVRQGLSREPSGTDEIRGTTEIGGAIGRITQAIEGELDQGDTFVVWLLDASISLVDDRKRGAEQLEAFFRSISSYDSNRHETTSDTLLMHAVVAYGNGAFEMVDATRYGAAVVHALQQVPPDQTGLENVMSAVQWAVSYYRGKLGRRERMMLVIWTDESGDDTMLLEDTIGLCQYAGVAVHVIGPSAVLGAERGSHLWTYQTRQSTQQYLLPVKRGPDTALPERAWLPYWHEHSLPPWRKGGIVSANNVEWYGGAYRERVLSGFGPYSLTRLALQTGGSFTIFDREGDRGPYDIEQLRKYVPSYDSAFQYTNELKKSQLRQAVSEVAMMTYVAAADLTPPKMLFVGARNDEYPYSISRTYYHPVAFRQVLAESLVRERARVMKGYLIVQKGLERMQGNRRVDMEYEYAKEDSRRWRAWYDLSKGRLLALAVRYQEYFAMCNLLLTQPNLLNPPTNIIAVHPYSELRDPASAEMAEESLRLLTRCIEANRDTPWCQLAQWELDTSLGVQIEQGIVPPPPPPPPVTFAPTPTPRAAIPFPNL